MKLFERGGRKVKREEKLEGAGVTGLTATLQKRMGVHATGRQWVKT
jgi:hypothetical protein